MTSLEDWRASGELWRWRGHDVFVRTAGTGTPLLLIHGFPTASWDFHAIWDELASRFRLLAVDLIGFGFSAKPRAFAYSIVAQADLLEALLAREGVTSYLVLAHDYGTSVSQELLARHANITSMCLLNGGMFPEVHRAALTQKLLASPLGPVVARLSSYRTFARTMTRIWGTTPPDPAELHAMWELVTANEGLRVMPELIGYLAERRAHRERWVTALARAPMPRRYICGLADPISGANMAARYRELVPAPDVVELAGVGHYPQVEAPRAVLDAVLSHVGFGQTTG